MKNFKYIIFLFAGILLLEGCKKDDEFPVPPASTVPEFSYSIDNDEFAPATVTFTNTSIVPEEAGSVTYYWNFGDSTTSEEINPVHVYENPGAYEVNLVVVTSTSLEIKENTKTIVIKDPNATGIPLFFTDGSLVYNGLVTNQPPIVTQLNGPSMNDSYGMAIDTLNSKLYISDYGADMIYQSDLDGSNFITFRSGVDSPNAMAIDYEENRIYWDTSNGIQSGDLSSTTQVEDFVTGQANDPDGLSIDPVNRVLYWVNYNGGVWKKNLDGSGESEIIPGVEGGSIIVANGRIYYDEYIGTNDIRLKSADLNGGDVATLATGITRVVYGLAYEASEDKIYWGDRNTGTIMRANPDGSNPEPWYVSEGSSPRGIVFGKAI